MKLRTRLFSLFLAISIVPTLIITFFAYSRYQDTVNQQMDVVTNQIFQNAVFSSNQTLDSIKQINTIFNFYSENGNTIISQLKDFADPDHKPDTYTYYSVNKQLETLIQSIIYDNNLIYGIYFFTPSGYVFNYSNSANSEISNNVVPEDEQWYKDTIALNGSMYISPVGNHEIFLNNKTSVFFASSLKDVYSHDFMGVLVINFSPELFDLSTVNTLPDITLLTIDNTDTNDVIWTNYDSLENVSFKENSRHVKHSDLSVYPLRLTAVFDYDSLYKQYSVTGLFLMTLALVLIVALIIASYRLSYTFILPIEHLSNKMASQKGHTLELTSRYLDRNDEIGTLFNEYNSMVDSLNTSIKQDYNDKLVALDAQMKSLEARINSHFLFNTLESINSMAELSDNEPIAKMSLSLGNMFRYTLKTKSEIVTLSDELNHVLDYASIQSIRFDNRFSLEVDLNDELLSQRVLKLILQPIVENSLYHGLNYCSYGDKITISGHMDQSKIYIDVSDNGKGIAPETLDRLTKELSEEASFTELGHRNKQSIGLKNIHSRIELYYGLGYGLSIESKQDEYTTVHITVPRLAGEEE
ncbi:MAG: sensor histidine kinase [Pseudobutyrivibrio sp.]|nr:sensor histidine kinase [Pseudobutyrivibrio sp.]